MTFNHFCIHNLGFKDYPVFLCGIFFVNVCAIENFTYIHIVKQIETYLTTKEVVDLLKVSRTTVHRLVQEKSLKPKKIGRANRYKLSDIEKMMK